MRTEELNYELPEELIAQTPAEPRDSSRLLVVKKSGEPFEARFFRDLPEFLKAGDVLVMNTAKVMPARLNGYKYPSGARIELLLLDRLPDEQNNNGIKFRGLIRRLRRLEPGDRILFPESRLVATFIMDSGDEGEGIVEFSGVENIDLEIEKIGRIPLPPYIKDYKGDISRYQTIYARKSGSVAAPTAGLHFTQTVLDNLRAKGVETAEIHLKVGWGTFKPIRSETLEEHHLHEEEGEITLESVSKINKAKESGGRVVAVGTTVTRLLESASDESGKIRPFSGFTGLYITPGYRFKCIDALITNFHLPGTSLLALVAAFMGVERTLEAYKYAVNERFRFYSFGDAMLIL